MSDVAKTIAAYDRLVERAIDIAKHVFEPGYLGDSHPLDESEIRSARLHFGGAVSLLWTSEERYEGGLIQNERTFPAELMDLDDAQLKAWKAEQAAKEADWRADEAAKSQARREAEERQQLAALKAKYEGVNA